MSSSQRSATLELDADTRRELAVASPAGFAFVASGGRWIPARHLLLISEQLCRIARGEIDRLMVFMPPRHGKPLYHGCMVLMGDGTRKRLGDIEAGDVVIGHSRQRCRVLAVHDQGELSAVKITTFSGREVTTALDHPFLTPNGWVDAGKLEVGDTLALLSEPQTTSAGAHRDEEFRLAGYFVGDGNTGRTSYGKGFAANITCYDPIEAEDIRACSATMGWVVREPRPGRFLFSGQIYRDPAGPRPWLREHKLAGRNSWTKRVPAFVFTGTPEQVGQFLGAYFACDGTLNSRRDKQGESRRDLTVEFNSVSPELLGDVRHLLLRLGVRSRLRPKASTFNGKPYRSWRLTITSADDAAKFVQRVPMVSVKAQRLAAWATKRTAFDAPFIPDVITALEPAGKVPCRCLTIEHDETFTVEDLVVHNSQLISEYTPPWFLGSFPDRRVILASYGAALASTWGRKARDLLTEFGPRFFDVTVDTGSQAAERWDIAGRPGGMVTAGIGGPITGRGAHLLVIDDPVKDAEEAASEVMRAKHVDWWQSVARTRLMPGGAVVLLQTRWNEGDLAGALLADMEAGGDQWEVLSLPAVAETDDDALGRTKGEALWPAFYDEQSLAQTKRAVGGYFWAALYQQRPAPPEGFLFKRKDFRYWRSHTEMIGVTPRVWLIVADDDGTRRFDSGSGVLRFQVADVAMSEKETADFTVVSTWASTLDGDLLLLDLERQHFEEQQVVQFLAAHNDKHGRPPLFVERFGAGRNPLATLARMGHPVREIPAEAGSQTDKLTRAFGAIALCEQHKLFFPSAPGFDRQALENELASFPNATHDDQVDVVSYAARLLPGLRAGGQGRKRHEPVDRPKPHAAGVRGMAF